MSGRLVLVRHGQSEANVERSLDTAPPGAPLTELGHQQAREFADAWPHPVGLVAHSVAVRAVQTAAEIAARVGAPLHEVLGVHEVQVGALEKRNDEAALAEFNDVYRRWQLGDLAVSTPGGESGNDVLDRYLPAVADLRMRYLDDDAWTGDVVLVSHGAAIRLVGAVLGGVTGEFALAHHLGNARCVVLAPITDERWCCLRWADATPPFESTDRPPDAAAARPVVGAAGADPMG